MKRDPYPSDLSDEEGQLMQPHIPVAKPGGRPREHSMREIVNAIFYVLKTGCQWRMLPHDFPPHGTVYHYFNEWRKDGTWERLNAALRGALREEMGCNREPSAGIADSQSVKVTSKRGLVAMMEESS